MIESGPTKRFTSLAGAAAVWLDWSFVLHWLHTGKGTLLGYLTLFALWAACFVVLAALLGGLVRRLFPPQIEDAETYNRAAHYTPMG
jgi:hypothetical protein